MFKVISRQVMIFFDFLLDVLRNRKLIFDLTKRDFKVRYLGSYLGIMWAFLQPLVTILVMWFVFENGLKPGGSDAKTVDPTALFLISGMIPWFFISDSINCATASVLDNTFLVKKVVFRVTILPIIKVLSAYTVHAFFTLVIFIVLILYGYYPNLYWLQLIYYQIALWILLLGISWFTSSVIVFIRDFGQIVGVVLQVLFWATPIIWKTSDITAPDFMIMLLKANPFYYIVDGYRTSLLTEKVLIWDDPWYFLYYWIFTIIVFIGGAYVFKRLRPHFADVI
ncbi:MAG: ABC transporter permease [Clostridiales bacterium]